MKPKILVIASSVVFLVLVLSLLFKDRAPTVIELLQSLSSAQRNCAEQIVGSNNLVFIEKQANDNTIAIGYLINQVYYASIFTISESSDCRIEFNEKVFDCYNNYLAQYCQGGYSGVIPHKIEQVELTGSPPLEVYVWFDVLGVGQRDSARHMFFVKQIDSSYKSILTLRLCIDLSSLEIMTASRTISATDDLVCDEFHGRKEHIEYSLLNGTAEPLQDSLDP